MKRGVDDEPFARDLRRFQPRYRLIRGARVLIHSNRDCSRLLLLTRALKGKQGFERFEGGLVKVPAGGHGRAP
jgi:hypothetical protein